MKKWTNRKILLSVCAAAVLAAEVLLLADLMLVWRGITTSLPIAALTWLGLTAAMAAGFGRKRITMLKTALGIPVVLAVLVSLGWVGWKSFSSNAAYEAPDNGKNQMYGDRRVMLIVPHQDDDINILGGVMEEYARYGSDLYAVFITNGDFYGQAEIRYQEAIRVFTSMGVPKENVIFLGYGDSWSEGGPHIYNAQSGMLMESHHGLQATYGMEDHPAYREGREYTIDNLTENLKSVILEYRADVLFCSDYDHHIDHKATTLLFDKVMGQLLKENPDYRPIVYKAYAYGTAWEAPEDYYGENILSTQNPFAEPYSQKPEVYRWEDRVRFPVGASTLSRSLMGSGAFARLAMYDSQGAQWQAAGVVNGDKVAWQRYTDSLCLTAEITADSGDVSLLNDFMLMENHDLVDEARLPYDGVWIPEGEGTAAVTLAQPSDIFSVVLYDHPSEEQNVLNAVITFDDGTMVETGPLDPGGAATSVYVGKERVSSFSVSLLETEGALAGLSEIEAFPEEPRRDGRFVKLIDEEENFLYDFRTQPEGDAELNLYIHGDLPELAGEYYAVNTAWGIGSAVLEDGVIRVNCPVGETMVLNVTCAEAGVSDSIIIRNPGTLERFWMDLWQRAEEQVYFFLRENGPENLIPKQLFTKISYKLRKGF